MTYTPDQWNAMLAPAVKWPDAYAAVQEQARLLLTRYHWQRPEGVSTVELAEALYPEAEARGPAAVSARRRIFKALAALTERGLADCATRGEPVQRKFGMIRPWIWHKPDPTRPVVLICPKCKRPL